MKLKIGSGLLLPLEAVTETFAILGRRGSGKTHTAVVMAEEMLAAGVPVVVLDPLDVWWGLRVSKDGKSAGFPIYVAGGSHEDIPLPSDAGKVLADAIVDKGLSMVLSVRHLSKSDQRRFVGEFCERLYDRKADPKHRTALHVFIDEADAFVPQRLLPGAERCYGAVDTMVRRGRSSGLAVTLISQRPQVIAKDVLSQTEVLVSHQLTGPQDRKALEAWIEANDTENQRAVFMGSLASLKKGTAWFWSPGLLGIFKQVEVRDRHTFDSSATPKATGGATASPKAFAAVDLEALTAEIAATIAKAKAEDPRELRKEIAALKAQAAKDRADYSKIIPAAKPEKAKEIPVLKDAQIAALDKALGRLEAAIEKAGAVLTKPFAAVREQLGAMTAAVQSIRQQPLPLSSPPAAPRREPLTPSKAMGGSRPVVQPARPAREAAESNGELSGPEHRILDAIAWMESIGVTEPQQTAVAFLAGYTIGGGAFNNPRGALRTKGYIDYRGDRIVLTDAGRSLANYPESPLTAEELQRRVLERLPGPEQKILTVLLNHYPASVENDALARAADYEPGGGAFNNPRGRLRSLGLIDYPQRGHVRALPLLFLEN